MLKKLRHNHALVHEIKFFVVYLALISALVGSSYALRTTPTAAKKTVATTTKPKVATQTKVAASKPAAVVPTPTPQPVAVATPTPVVVKHIAVPANTTKPTPVVTPSPSSNVSSLTPTTTTTPPATTNNTPPPATTNSYASTNWSGYMATSGTFTSISASWTATSPTGNGVSTSADATWIGIGGVSTSDLIQIGTDNTVSAAGQVSSEAFYELLPNYSITVPDVTVSPGDSITASITETSPSQWDMYLKDNTNGESYTNNTTYASALSSAEWIQEDPSYSAYRLVPLDTFGSASFTGAKTTMNGSLVSAYNANSSSITLVNNSDQILATPSTLGADGASFTVTQH
jgi:hypothetical protein